MTLLAQNLKIIRKNQPHANSSRQIDWCRFSHLCSLWGWGTSCTCERANQNGKTWEHLLRPTTLYST